MAGFSFDTSAPAFNFGTTGTDANAFNFSAPAATTNTGFDWGTSTTTQPTNQAQGLNLGGLGTNNAFNIGGFNTGGAVPFVKPNTKFTDLPDNYKKKYQELEQFIQAQRKTRDEIADDIKKPIPRENISVDSLNERLASLSRDIQKESRGLQTYIDRVRNELKYGEQAARNLTKAKAQRTGAAPLFNTTVPLPSQYHWEKLSAFNDSLDRITRQIDEIDQYLVATEQNATASNSLSRFAAHPKALQQILLTQHTALCALTARVAQLHSLCDELREKYRALKTEENHLRGGGYRGLSASSSSSSGAVGSSALAYPSVFGSTTNSGSSLYDKVAGGGGNELIGSGGIVFEGENDDAIDEKKNRADPFSELSFLNSSTSTSLVPQPPQQTAATGTQPNAAGTGTGTATATTSGPTFDFFGGSNTTGQTTNTGTTFPSFGATTATTAQQPPAIPSFSLNGTGTTDPFSFGSTTNNAFSFGNTGSTPAFSF